MSIQRALVIGAGSGVGQASASALTAAGVHVLASGRGRDATDSAQVASLLAEAGESVEAYMNRRVPVRLDAAGVARAIVSIAEGDEHRDATLLALTADGLEVI